jgi:hypothetical protein
MFRIAAGLVVGLLALASTAQAQQAAAAPAPNPFTFNTDGGAILNFIKADKTADFEMVMGKVKEALMKSTRPDHKGLATGWKIFKAAEPGPNGAAIYVFVFDPATKGGDYSVGNILVDGFGAEGQALYKTYSDSFGMPAIGALLHLTKVADLGQ